MQSEHPSRRSAREADGLFAGEGEMARLCREMDWAATPLGPVDQWPQSLRTAVGMVIAQGIAQSLCWAVQALPEVRDQGFVELLDGVVATGDPFIGSEVPLRALVAPLAEARGITLSVDVCDPALCLHADEERTRQILLNLVGNAIKFTQPGGRVQLSCSRRAEWIDVRVRDNGPGIAPEKQETIFDPFVQVERRFSNPCEGVGLGLAISRDLARAMGGELSVESAPGEGSTFTLRLPLAEQD